VCFLSHPIQPPFEQSIYVSKMQFSLSLCACKFPRVSFSCSITPLTIYPLHFPHALLSSASRQASKELQSESNLKLFSRLHPRAIGTFFFGLGIITTTTTISLSASAYTSARSLFIDPFRAPLNFIFFRFR
jgi:hypothetical protein